MLCSGVCPFFVTTVVKQTKWWLSRVIWCVVLSVNRNQIELGVSSLCGVCWKDAIASRCRKSIAQCDLLRWSLTDSKELAYARSSLAAFSESWVASSPALEVLRMEQRLVCEAEGEMTCLEGRVISAGEADDLPLR